MRVRYFPDTDTLLIDFSNGTIAETQDLTENILIELDQDRRLVSMTIEHAKQYINVSEFSCQLAET